VARLVPLFSYEGIYIVTVRGQGELIREHLPEIPSGNIIEEPLPRNTAPCIGLVAILLKQIDSAAVMVALPADHFIENEERFRQALTLGMQVAKDGYFVTLGIIPDRPAIGYGYIKISSGQGIISSQDVLSAYHIECFVEKPSLERAKDFLDTGEYYWNSGIFIWKVERILEEIARHMPELYRELKEIEAHWGTPELGRVISEIYRKQEAISIDHGVLERAGKLAIIPVEMGWSDLGDWNSLSSVFGKDEGGNVIRAKHVGIGLKDSIIFSSQDRLIATIGLENIMIVDTPEALLVMDRTRAQEV
jgi:mannose-1-phosphate guanylyltransferase